VLVEREERVMGEVREQSGEGCPPFSVLVIVIASAAKRPRSTVAEAGLLRSARNDGSPTPLTFDRTVPHGVDPIALGVFPDVAIGVGEIAPIPTSEDRLGPFGAVAPAATAWVNKNATSSPWLALDAVQPNAS